MKYVVVSPVKDEERNIERTLLSMVAQTSRPVVWVIVDDGSSDRTASIVERYAREHEFVRLLRNPRRSARQTGIAEVLAFNAGLQQLKKVEFDCVVKLDGDLSFEPDYFQQILQFFSAEPKLGIASGVYQEDRGAGWEDVWMPHYHACGASKVVRRHCFDEIGGFIAERGWDTLDEIRAMALGWKTTHYADIRLKHWKLEGTGMGLLQTCYMHGEIYYRLGGSPGFFVLKVLNRLRNAPVISGGSAMCWGFVHSFLKRRTLLVNPEERQLYRALLSARLGGSLGSGSSKQR